MGFRVAPTYSRDSFDTLLTLGPMKHLLPHTYWSIISVCLPELNHMSEVKKQQCILTAMLINQYKRSISMF